MYRFMENEELIFHKTGILYNSRIFPNAPPGLRNGLHICRFFEALGKASLDSMEFRFIAFFGLGDLARNGGASEVIPKASKKRQMCSLLRSSGGASCGKIQRNIELRRRDRSGFYRKYFRTTIQVLSTNNHFCLSFGAQYSFYLTHSLPRRGYAMGCTSVASLKL